MEKQLRIEDDGVSLRFLDKSNCLAVYHYKDAFKPYFHPLCTPRGHCLSLAMPHDHKHHKGLMYALRTADTNFWEEIASHVSEQVGSQRHVCFKELITAGETVGFTEELCWENTVTGKVLFNEIRTIICSLREDGLAYTWSWKTELRATEALELIQSQWSYPHSDGSRTNYHGLGIRLRREFGGGTQNNALALDGVRHQNRRPELCDFTAYMGTTPKEVTFSGAIDGAWPVQRAAVTFSQSQQNTLYVMEAAFAFMALGPSNAAPVTLVAGQLIKESYRIDVADEVV